MPTPTTSTPCDLDVAGATTGRIVAVCRTHRSAWATRSPSSRWPTLAEWGVGHAAELEHQTRTVAAAREAAADYHRAVAAVEAAHLAPRRPGPLARLRRRLTARRPVRYDVTRSAALYGYLGVGFVVAALLFATVLAGPLDAAIGGADTEGLRMVAPTATP